MNISIKDVDQCVKEITITIPSQQALNDYHSVLQKFKNYVVVPGFRKGKAPLSMVDNLFFDQARESYLKEKVYDYYEAAIKEKDIKPMYEGVPTNIDWEKGKDLTMVFRYEVEPTVEIKKYTGLEVPYNHTEFSEEMIDSTIENIRKNMARDESVDGPVESGDQISITIDKLNYNSEPKEKPEDVKKVKLHENNYGERFNKDLLGSMKGNVLETEIKEGDEVFKVSVKVNEISRSFYPEVNEEFAKNADFESLVQMRQDIEKNLRKQLDSNNQREKQNNLLVKLFEANPFDVPPTSVISYSHKLAEPYARLLNKKPEDIANYYTKTAYFEIKSYYLITELIKIVPLEVTEEDEKMTIAELAEELNLNVDEYLEKNPDVTKREEFVNRIKEKKLFDYLMENNKFVEVLKESDEKEESNQEESEPFEKKKKEE